jgi:hypothetical protein
MEFEVVLGRIRMHECKFSPTIGLRYIYLWIEDHKKYNKYKFIIHVLISNSIVV